MPLDSGMHKNNTYLIRRNSFKTERKSLFPVLRLHKESHASAAGWSSEPAPPVRTVTIHYTRGSSGGNVHLQVRTPGSTADIFNWKTP